MSTSSVEEVVTNVQVGDAVAQYVEGDFPEGETPAAPTLTGSSEIVRGGSMILQVRVAEDVERLLVGLEGDFGGYYRIDLPTSTASKWAVNASNPGSNLMAEKYPDRQHTPPRVAVEPLAADLYTLVITIASTVDYDNFSLLVASGACETVSVTASHKVEVNEAAAASDDLQVSLNWTAPVDLDLHVETPAERIFTTATEPVPMEAFWIWTPMLHVPSTTLTMKILHGLLRLRL